MSHPPIRLPRWLGTPSPKTPIRSRDGEREDKPAFLVYEWDEHSFAPKPQETRQRAADVMRRLPARGVVLILGVPGQGKTTLLKEWQDSLERPTLLGECRSVNKLGEDENILEVMFKKGVNTGQPIQNWQAEPRLVVLVDALDELSANEDWENALADAIRSAAESQTVVLSCRTHVWQDRLETPLSITGPIKQIGDLHWQALETHPTPASAPGKSLPPRWGGW